jgi:hypothetical protein
MKKRRTQSSDPAPKAKGKRLSAPLVLAIASGMVSIGVVAGYSGLKQESLSHHGHQEARLMADRKTPERVCEAFLDAWIRQRFDVALELSDGNARNTVISRMARNEESVPGVIALETDWEVFARDPLKLVIEESHRKAPDLVLVRGAAEGKLMDLPYRRAMEFDAVQRKGEWYVEEMRPGEVLNGIPVITPDHDPAELKMREPP